MLRVLGRQGASERRAWLPIRDGDGVGVGGKWRGWKCGVCSSVFCDM